MAAGIPIIATDVGACQEVLQNGALGQLVPEGDAAAIAAAVLHLAARPDGNRARLDEAKARALKVFSIDEMAGRYARCLRLT